MNYLDALKIAHTTLEPQCYVEIGCRQGLSLSLARCPSIAIDPDIEITHSLTAPTRIFAQTSDDFFARTDLWDILEQRPDLSFIDGMHQVEFALRDFINLEMCSKPSSVILIDDILPEDVAWTTRTREGQYWTGDVYRLIPILRRFRPDLEIVVYDIEIKGLVVISNLDPNNRVLVKALDSIQREIDAGSWMATSVQVMREILGPLSPDGLEAHLLKHRQSNFGQRTAGSQFHAQIQYLELLKKSLLNEIYLDDELRLLYLRDCLNGKESFDYAVYHDIRNSKPEAYEALQASREIGRFPERNIHRSGFSHTMMGRKRLDSLHECLDRIRNNAVPGDLVECGVWRGGGCILMAAYLQIFGMPGRRVFVADSFEGLPKPTLAEDVGLDLSIERSPELAVRLDTVKANFEIYDLLADNVVFLKGWFKDTLPAAPIDEIAVLRLDGDLYESTMDSLEALYDKVASEGVVIVDDYGALETCRKAISDFFARRSEPLPHLSKIDWTGVFWTKKGAG